MKAGKVWGMTELIEKLEQLRWLKNGWQIGCLSVYFNGVEITTPVDVVKWKTN
jgi:CMP-2-keto-3-deoxyoctulosonic acid synthetase